MEHLNTPILWRSATNDIPEAGLVQKEGQEDRPPVQEITLPLRQDDSMQARNDVVGERVDRKKGEEMTTEERLD